MSARLLRNTCLINQTLGWALFEGLQAAEQGLERDGASTQNSRASLCTTMGENVVV